MPMNIRPSKIFMNPFTLLPDGDRFDTYEYGLDDSSVDGWNVQASGLINGTAGILDDEDFADIDSAHIYAQNLSRKYQIGITRELNIGHAAHRAQA